jgi:hypothetical protein
MWEGTLWPAAPGLTGTSISVWTTNAKGISKRLAHEKDFNYFLKKEK